MRKLFCDVCGKEITERFYKLNVEFEEVRETKPMIVSEQFGSGISGELSLPFSYEPYYSLTIHATICPECKKSIDKIMEQLKQKLGEKHDRRVHC